MGLDRCRASGKSFPRIVLQNCRRSALPLETELIWPVSSRCAAHDMSNGQLGRLIAFIQGYHRDAYDTGGVSTYPGQRQGRYHKTDLRLICRSLDERFGAELLVEKIEGPAVLARTNVGGSALVESRYLYLRNCGFKLLYDFLIRWRVRVQCLNRRVFFAGTR